MSRKISIFAIVLVSLLIVAGCSALGGQSQTQAQVTPEIIVVTATPVPEEKVVVITATPAEVTPEYIVITATPEATSSSPTATVGPAIKMANTYFSDPRTLYISWNADGNMANGFEVLWSTTNSAPTFPADSSTYISDINGRTVSVQVEPGRTYYVRVCRYVSGSCDLYSDVLTVTNNGSTSTTYAQPTQGTVPQYPIYRTEPVWLNQPSDMSLHPTATSSSSSSGTSAISITSVRSSTSGSAVIRWSASGSFPYGFLVLYGSSVSTPTYGDYPYYTVSSSSARSTTVSGAVGTTYYFRVCRYTGSSCDTYSNVYSFTF